MSSNELIDLFDETTSDWSSGDDFSTPVPDGKYKVELLTAEIAETKNGDPFFKLKVRIAEKPFAGRWLFPAIFLRKDPEAMSRVKRDLKVFGCKGTKFAEIKAELPHLNGHTFSLTKKTSPNPKNPERPFENYSYAPLGKEEPKKLTLVKDTDPDPFG